MPAVRESRDFKRTPELELCRAHLEARLPDDQKAHDHKDVSRYASSPCLMHELEFNYVFLSSREVLQLLNELLKDERAGVKAVSELWPQPANATLKEVLKDIVQDESANCRMLTRHILGLGGNATRETGRFLADLRAAPRTVRIELLKRRKHRIMRQVHMIRHRIKDPTLRRDLEEMAARHVLHCSLCTNPPPMQNPSERETESNSRRNVALNSSVHPVVYAAAVWCVICMLLSAWFFFNNGSDVTLALVGISGLSAVFVGIPAVLWHVWRHATQGQTTRLAEWMHGEFEGGSGRIQAKDAAIMVLLLPVASAIGLTVLSLIAYLAAVGAL